VIQGLCLHTKWFCLGLFLVIYLQLSACVGVSSPERDYSLYKENMPRSILVLPPTSDSVEVNAPYSYLTTVTKPLAEKGYYVFPVALVDVMMKENGLPLPEDMHTVTLDKLGEVFGADAVMYIHLFEYGQNFRLLSSVTEVGASARLVDVKTGSELWSDSVKISRDNQSNNQGGLIGALVEAVATQIVADSQDYAHPAAREANNRLVRTLLVGPLDPEFELIE